MSSVRALLGFVCAIAGLPFAGHADVRVVSQTVGTDEALLALAAPSQIAALSPLAHDPAFSAAAREAAPYPCLVANGDAESVLRFHPTLVLCADYSRAELVSQLRASGVRVVVFDRYATLEDSYVTLRRIAAEIGAADRAEQVIAAARQVAADLARRLAGVHSVRVLAPSIYGAVPGEDTTFNDLCVHAGADNLAASLGRWRGNRPPPAEQILTWPVDQLVLGGESIAATLAPFRKLPPYAYLPSVAAGRAVVVPAWVMGCVSYRRVEGYVALARALHPARFP